MKKPYRRLLLVISLLMLLSAIAIYFVPYQSFAEKKIISTLEAMGIKINSLRISKLGSTQASLIDIDAGDEKKLQVKSLDAEYILKDLRNKKIRSLNIDGLNANVYKSDTGWQIGSLEKLNSSKKSGAGFNFTEIQNILPQKITISNSNIEAIVKEAIINLPFDLSVNSDSEKISGKLIGKNITTSGLPYNLPPLNLDVNYSFTEKDILANIYIHDSANQYLAKMDLTAPAANPALGKLKINNLLIPWGGGQVSINSTEFPLNMKQPIKINLRLKAIDLSAMLGEVSDQKINGTGKISGILPIIYYPDGKVTLQQGNAAAEDAGTIIVSPDLLQGDNAGLVIARETLQNFHYTTLKIQVSSDKNEKSIIQLSLEGKNPDANNGRPVKLNIKIAGDVMPLVQQSLLSINNLKELIQIKDTK